MKENLDPKVLRKNRNVYKKTIKASVIELTNIKKELLDFDYDNYQWWMVFGIDNGILSCFKAHKN